jgi:hypothetical protein
MGKKKMPGPTTGPWKIGAYYKSTSDRFITEAWGQQVTPGVKVKKGAIWLCHSGVLKLRKNSPWRDEMTHQPFMRLVTYDPRFEAELKRYVHYDAHVWDGDDRTQGFEEITSPLVVLALCSGDLAP